jgi:hypothetical protein
MSSVSRPRIGIAVNRHTSVTPAGLLGGQHPRSAVKHLYRCRSFCPGWLQSYSSTFRYLSAVSYYKLLRGCPEIPADFDPQRWPADRPRDAVAQTLRDWTATPLRSLPSWKNLRNIRRFFPTAREVTPRSGRWPSVGCPCLISRLLKRHALIDTSLNRWRRVTEPSAFLRFRAGAEGIGHRCGRLASRDGGRGR